MSDKDSYAKTLDYLQKGRAGEKNEPTAQVLGTENFSLLEVVLSDGIQPRGGEQIYIGDGERDKVEYIKQRLDYSDLTSNARSELEYVVKAIVSEDEEEFVDFFNNATPVTPRRHAFELLPGVGKKTRDRIIDERDKQEFESYEDISNRVDSLKNPEDLIKDRIMNELKEETKKLLFT
jgi:putative nucleotide binding protein